MDISEGMAAFRAQYRIPNGVELQHCELGEWLVMNRPLGSLVISMIAFIKGGMEIPMGRLLETSLWIIGWSLHNAPPTSLESSVV